MRKSFYLRAVSASAICAFAATLPAVARAQAPGAATTEAMPAEAARDDGGLEDIVVTAQRRAENSQDVPIAIAAFGSEQMERIGLTSTEDLPTALPGLSSAPTAIRGFLFLRGVGGNSNNTSPSVLTYVDGVLQTFSPPVFDFSDVEQISVAKGPQGTLFGRNATAGVIQITTSNPMTTQGVEMEAGYANYDTVSLRFKGATKLAENVAIGVSGYYVNQMDGWGTNVFDGSDAFTAKRWGGRVKIVADLDDTLTATVTADYSYNWGQVGVAYVASVGQPLYDQTADQQFRLPGRFDLNNDVESFGRNRLGGASLTLEKQLGDVKLLSITSYRQAKELLVSDSDATATPFARLQVNVPRSSFTQELQLSGGDRGFTWVTGLYYYYFLEKPVLTFGQLFPTVTFPFLTPLGEDFVVRARAQTDAYAAYAQATVEIVPDTNLTLGARYTIEKKRIFGTTSGNSTFSVPTPFGPFFPLNPAPSGDNTTFRKPSFRASIDHRFSPELLVYASYNRGFNAGFYNASSVTGFSRAANPPVNPEKIDAYEIGLKSDLLDRHLQINVAAFRYDYSNLQQQVIEQGTLFPLNAGSARIKGVDLDIVARPVRELTLAFSGNYLDTKYLSYVQAPFYSYGPTGEFIRANDPVDARGNRLVQAPKFSLQATATYTLQTSVGTFDTTGNIHRQTTMYADPQNDFPIPARTLINLSEKWTSNDESSSIMLWIKNLTNKDYDVSQTLVAPVGLAGTPGAPRTYGVTLSQRF